MTGSRNITLGGFEKNVEVNWLLENKKQDRDCAFIRLSIAVEPEARTLPVASSINLQSTQDLLIDLKFVLYW